jgi:hypothetical protein
LSAGSAIPPRRPLRRRAPMPCGSRCPTHRPKCGSVPP